MSEKPTGEVDRMLRDHISDWNDDTETSVPTILARHLKEKGWKLRMPPAAQVLTTSTGVEKEESEETLTIEAPKVFCSDLTFSL